MYVLAWRDGVSGYRFILIGIGVAGLLRRPRRLRAQPRPALRGPAGDALADRLGRPGQRRRAAAAARRPARPAARSPCCCSGSCGRSSSATTPPAALGAAHRAQPRRPARHARSCWSPWRSPWPARSSSSRWSPARSPTGCSAPPPAASLAAALVGAALLLTADLVAVHLLPTPLPTGVVTGAVGAPYLLWLLATTNRQGARRMTPTARRGPDPRLRRPAPSSPTSTSTSSTAR